MDIRCHFDINTCSLLINTSKHRQSDQQIDIQTKFFLLWQHTTTSYKTEKKNSDFPSFIRSGSMLPQ